MKEKNVLFYRKIQGTKITFNVCASKISLKHPHNLNLLISLLIIKWKSKQETIGSAAAMKLLFYVLFSFFSLNGVFSSVWWNYPTYLLFPALVKSSLLPLALPMNDMHSSNYFLVLLTTGRLQTKFKLSPQPLLCFYSVFMSLLQSRQFQELSDCHSWHVKG